MNELFPQKLGPHEEQPLGRIRLLQWNVLADGLAYDGFLMLPHVKEWPVAGDRVRD